MRLALALLCLPLLTLPAAAWEVLSAGNTMTNDAFATITDDRWRTASSTFSLVLGKDWGGALPTRLGALLELRSHAEIIAPANLRRPSPADRRYAQVLSFGVHSYQAWRGLDTRIGLEVALTGPQVGLSTLQGAIHDVISAPGPEPALPGQIPNGVHVQGSSEAGWRFDLGPRLSVRPFVEGQAGIETLARAGVDLQFGATAADLLFLRDTVTGQRAPGQRSAARGWTAHFGADVAYVAKSLYLPDGSAAVLTPVRGRLRTGLHWGGERVALFYGLTYLTKEFDAQRSGQLLGSVRVDIAF